ncbi:hypothetical protein SAMN02745823_03775 [Sporobacter termitidis DSM 10068]|uniref:Uncharacterized protein n=1 Tax=Sporobacter termitidis DSM 10068 TaxID=1123282 RepID=A0A1M5ZIU8_9FIRM|nr:hypothetical protein SAMN02745823_03775 [Sporobacter termitidis DSM 10068]
MPREREGYREQLSDILEYFDDRRLLSVSDVSRYLGISRQRARKRLNITGDKGVSATELARKLIT